MKIENRGDSWFHLIMGHKRDDTSDERDRITVQDAWGSDKLPGEAIVDVMAATTGRDPSELPPLQRTVDIDALNALLAADADRRVRISFVYDDMSLTVESDGRIRVRPDKSGD